MKRHSQLSRQEKHRRLMTASDFSIYLTNAPLSSQNSEAICSVRFSSSAAASLSPLFPASLLLQEVGVTRTDAHRHLNHLPTADSVASILLYVCIATIKAFYSIPAVGHKRPQNDTCASQSILTAEMKSGGQRSPHVSVSPRRDSHFQICSNCRDF